MVAPKGAVGVSACLSANLALQEFFQAINFHFTTCTQKKSFVMNLLYQDIHRPQLGSWIGCVTVDESQDWMVSKRSQPEDSYL